MATTAHCLYCFESLSASLENRKGLTLKQVEQLWAHYELERNRKELGQAISKPLKDVGDDAEMTDIDSESQDGEEDEGDDEEEEGFKEEITATSSALRPPATSRLHPLSPTSDSSTPSTLSAASSQAALGESSKSSSKSSFFSFGRKSQSQSPIIQKEEEHPLFVTWNTVNSRGHKSLRGCIGTFEAQELSKGLKSYALTSALDDVRFAPIDRSEVPSLAVDINLLMRFTPCSNPLDWDLETHGIRISFTHHGKRYGSTYLPDVALEQGWTKEETIVSLMRKAGWSGRSGDWRKMNELKVIRYEGMKAGLRYQAFQDWRSWVDSQ